MQCRYIFIVIPHSSAINAEAYKVSSGSGATFCSLIKIQVKPHKAHVHKCIFNLVS